MQELCTATDLALRATKVTARALGQTMSTLVVQEHHLWLTLADTRETDKHRFLDSPISQAGLFGEAVEDFAQQFSAAQKHSAPTVCCSLHLATGSTLLRPPPLPQQQPLQQQPSRRSTLPSHVATRPPSPPMESEASEVA